MLSTILAIGKTCFNETKTVYWMGTSVPADLPTVTTLIGGWQSATVSMYITKILLEEKMGVEVALWPTASEDYTAWYTDYDDRYPVTQYEWLNNRDIDYIIECWELSKTNEEVKELFALQNIKELCNLGTLGQMYLFVPYYTIKEHVTLGWYESLHKEDFIDIFLNDSLMIFDKYKSVPKFFSRFYRWTEGDENRFDVEYANGTTVQTRPFIFGFKPVFQMSKDLWDRMHVLGLNNTWDLWFVESELVLTKLMKEMFAAKMNVITHLYSPTNELGEFDWEKLNFPFPQETTCYEDKTCEEKLDILFTTANVQAMEEFPEVLTFLSRVRLSNIDINHLIASSNEYNYSTVYDSVCKWLRENPEDWSHWIVDIQREFPSRLNLESEVVIVIWTSTVLFTALTLLALTYLLKNKEKPLVREVSPAFFALACVSGILVAFAGALWTLDDYKYGLPICASRWIFACTGNTVLFTSLSLKTWQSWEKFKNHGDVLSNRVLYRYIVLVYIPVAGLLIWKTIEMYEEGLVFRIADDGVEYQYECPDSQAGVFLFLFQWVIAFISLWLCLKATAVPQYFNENVHIMYLCIFIMLLMGFGVIVFQSAGDTPRVRAIIVFLSHLMAAVVIEISVLGRTIYLLVSGKAERGLHTG